MSDAPVRIGTAGWAIPRAVAEAFPSEGSALSRYAGAFGSAEINTSFYRPHKPETYARWAESVPDGFRFAVKMPKAITHDGRLVGQGEAMARFLAETDRLGTKRGPLLIQLPPGLAFDPRIVDAFLADLRGRTEAPLVCEPRHASWFGPEADGLLAAHRVARVAADPARAPGADEPGGWSGLLYVRLHGSPHVYRSAYSDAALDAIASRLMASAVEAWCIFDNTASGAAAADALRLRARIAPEGRS